MIQAYVSHGEFKLYLCIKLILLHKIYNYLYKFEERGGWKLGAICVHRYNCFLPQNSWQEVTSFKRFWGQILVYSLTEMIMILLTARECCTLYDNRLEKASQKVIIMRISRRTYFRLWGWEGIIHLMEQAVFHIRVDVILLLLRILLKLIFYTLGETFAAV